jgi:hypothetical protein
MMMQSIIDWKNAWSIAWRVALILFGAQLLISIILALAGLA